MSIWLRLTILHHPTSHWRYVCYCRSFFLWHLESHLSLDLICPTLIFPVFLSQLFDNEEYDSRTPEDWLALGYTEVLLLITFGSEPGSAAAHTAPPSGPGGAAGRGGGREGQKVRRASNLSGSDFSPAQGGPGDGPCRADRPAGRQQPQDDGHLRKMIQKQTPCLASKIIQSPSHVWASDLLPTLRLLSPSDTSTACRTQNGLFTCHMSCTSVTSEPRSGAVERVPRVPRLCPHCSGSMFDSTLCPFAAWHSLSLSRISCPTLQLPCQMKAQKAQKYNNNN